MIEKERVCPKCGKKMYIRTSAYGEFFTCEDKHCGCLVKVKKENKEEEE